MSKSTKTTSPAPSRKPSRDPIVHREPFEKIPPAHKPFIPKPSHPGKP